MMGDVEAIGTSEVPVEVDNLFDSGTFNENHRVILVIGSPGIGKTSLAFYFCREWAVGNLSMFDVVAFIQLRNLASTEVTTTLSDLLLLACHSTGQENEVILKEMVLELISPSLKLLLIFDGWDELPSNIRKPSFVTSILKLMSSQSKILITSRPGCLVDMYEVANRVEIVGFTEKNIREYFWMTLSTKRPQEVKEGCREVNEYFLNYPTVQSCCYIPLNAAIIARLFLTKGTLPSTRHELLLVLILDHVNKNLQDHYSFEDLSQLDQLSMLAFECLKQNQVIFTLEKLSHQALPCDNPGYGLLRSVVSHEKKTTTYHFIHLTLQEFLAAYHISQLEEDKQVQVFQHLLYDHRFSTVLQFYAAFTGFSNQGVRNAITGEELSKEKMVLFNIIRCLFEAQIDDEQLYQQVASNLDGNLDLADVNMTSLDCKAKSLAKFLSFCTSLRKLDISHNNISDKGIADIATALQSNTTLKELHLVSCGISDFGAKSIAQMLATCGCSSLEVLVIRGNEIGVKGITYISNAFQTHKTLQVFDVGGQTVTDSEVVSLATLCAKENNLTNCLSLTWSSLLPENTLKNLAVRVCDSVLQSLNLCIVQPSGTAPLSAEVEEEWFQHVVAGGKDLLLLLETNQYLRALSLQLRVSNSSFQDKDTLALITLHSTAESVNSARKEKGLYEIKFMVHKLEC